MSVGNHQQGAAAAASGPGDVDTMTLADFVVHFPVQSRVRKLVLDAKGRGVPGADLPIGDLRAERPGQLQACIPNMGSRTATYLERRILEVRLDVLARAKPPARAGRTRASDPLAWSLAEFVARHPVSTQVDGAIRRAATQGIRVARTPIRRIPTNYIGWCYALQKAIPHFPLRAVQQLVVALSTFLSRHPEPGAPMPIGHATSRFPDVPPERFHGYATDALAPACRRVLEARTGIQPRCSLRVLAAEFDASTEQVRTLEKRARHTLRALGIRYRARQTLDGLFHSWWPRLCEGGIGYTAARPFHALFGAPELYLMEALGGVEACLAHYCDRTRDGWLLKSDTSQSRIEEARRLEAELSTRWILPQPVSRIARRLHLADRDIEVLLLHSQSLTIEQDYAVVSARRRPTVLLDRTLTDARIPLAVSELRDRVGDRRRSSAPRRGKAAAPPSAGELNGALRSAPHLFLRIWDHQWCSLTELPERLRAAPYEDRGSLEPLPSGGTTRAAMQWLLQDQGPLSWAELMRSVPSTGSGTLAATLARCPDIVKCAPGMYGYRDRLGRHVNAPPRTFFQEQQASALAFGRRAGLGADFYPFWTPRNERALCEWARGRASARVYRALVSESEPAAWPGLGDDATGFWRREQERGAFTLGAAEELGFEGTFAASRLLALLIVARLQGRISWMEANRCLGARVNARSGTFAVAALAMLGALTPDPDWRRSQTADRAGIDSLLPVLLEPLRRTGHLDWSTVESRIDLSSMEVDWIRPDAVGRFLQRARRAEG